MSSQDTAATGTLTGAAAPPDTPTEAMGDRSTSNSQSTNSTRTRGQPSNNTFRISNFKGKVREVGAVIGTKLENRRKDSMTLFQEKIASYIIVEKTPLFAYLAFDIKSTC